MILLVNLTNDIALVCHYGGRVTDISVNSIFYMLRPCSQVSSGPFGNMTKLVCACHGDDGCSLREIPLLSQSMRLLDGIFNVPLRLE